jgi:hypothetical protein
MRFASLAFVSRFLVAFGILIPVSTFAASPSKKIPPSQSLLPSDQICRPAIVSAESSGRLPARLLEAIAVVESGRLDKQTGVRTPWPWTINAEGEGYFFDSKAQAIAAVRALQARGVASIDVGCMQVNLLHHPNAFASLEEAFDPYANARYAARFLNELYARTTNWPQATGFYHSQTPELSADYQRRVLAVWEKPGGRAPILIQPIPVFNAGFAAFPRSGFVDVIQGGEHYRAFVPASQNFAAFSHGGR